MIINNCNLPDREFEAIKDFLYNKLYRDFLIDEQIFLIRISNLNIENRKLLRKAINKNPYAKFIITSTNKDVAMFAWRVHAFHFLIYPITTNQLKTLKHKINVLMNNREDAEKIKMTFLGGFQMIHPNEICVIRGKGDYCEFFLQDKKTKLFTSRISEIYKCVSDIPYIYRINKSLIINVNHLKSVKKDSVFFKSNPVIKLKTNQKNISKIKKELLWLNKY